MVVDTNNPANYRVVKEDGKLYVYGKFVGMQFDRIQKKWLDRCCIADEHNKILELITNNVSDRILRMMVRRIKGAKLVKSWERDNCIDDPYGRMVKIGTIRCEIWDLSNCI